MKFLFISFHCSLTEEQPNADMSNRHHIAITVKREQVSEFS
jgi:hypothetical protein